MDTTFHSFIKTSTQFFNGNPYLNFLFFIFAVLAIVLSIYLYAKSIKTRIPTYMVRTIKLVQDKIQKIGSLEISYSGEKINNLSISKIVLWNAGKETISNEDVAHIQPLKLEIKEGNKILDAQILFQKNPSNAFNISLSPDNRFVHIDFDYFDLAEGIVLQIIHTGKENKDLFITGSIKSVKEIKRKSVGSSSIIFLTMNSRRSRVKTYRRIFASVVTIMGLVLLLLVFFNDWLFTPTPHSTTLSKILFLILGIIYVAYGLTLFKRDIPNGFDIFEQEFLS